MVASNDDSGGTLDSHIVFTPSSAGTYYLVAKEAGGDALGSYTLSSNAALDLAIGAVNTDRAEGNSGLTALTFSVARSGETASAVSVDWSVSGIGGSPADAQDFASAVLPSGTLTFASGETLKLVTVNVRGDTQAEASEALRVTLANATAGATISQSTADGQIQNDDAPPPSLSIDAVNANLAEGNAGSTPFTFTVTRTGDTGSAVAASWAVIGQGPNAADAADFAGGALPSGTVTFDSGVTSKTIVVNVQGDSLFEQNDGFSVNLSNPTNGALLGVAAASGLILNDDALLNPVIGTEGDDILVGTASADHVQGLGGNDLVSGGPGNDTMDGGTGLDTVTYEASGKNVAIDLGTDKATRGTTEIEWIYSIENATGSNVVDTIRGDDGNNVLLGLGGNDALFGLGGNDLLAGGANKDTMTGGDGLDVFDFNAKTELAVGANRDVVQGFDNPGAVAGDLFDLLGIDAKDGVSGNQAFVWRGTSAFNGTGQLRVFNSGSNTIVAGSTDADNSAEFEIAITDGAFTAANYLAADFVL